MHVVTHPAFIYRSTEYLCEGGGKQRVLGDEQFVPVRVFSFFWDMTGGDPPADACGWSC